MAIFTPRALQHSVGLMVVGALALTTGPTGCGSLPSHKNAGSSGGYGSFGSGGVYAAMCPASAQCNVSCSGGGTTSISGKVYDPAGKNPLYNVAVYVPGGSLQPLPRGVPTGSDACNCAALFKSGAVVSTATGVDGSFKLTNAPVGSQVPLVVQVGKWRRLVNVGVTSCQDNPQPDGSLTLPSTVTAADTNDNIPDIAVSTGEADTLECLMSRIGLSATEYVAGGDLSGHVHVFAGGAMGAPIAGVGKPEVPPMMGAPPSSTALWASQDQLMPYDITVLSCEGEETYAANPPALEAYLNAGGRAFASHFHYAWFSGPLSSAGTNNYAAPPDWGTHLATWNPGGGKGTGPVGGIIDTTLKGSTITFPKGQALQQWLTNLGALGQNGVPAGELSIYTPRYDAIVGVKNTPSQSWITADARTAAGRTMYFSFDTPVNAPDGSNGEPQYCGRAVFSDLHVAGDPSTNDSSPPPGGCAVGDLSPQEKVLEFMLFDLSSCVIPDTVAPPTTGVPVVQ